jgi:multiple sugar transport system ATP-binding protein
MTLGQRIVVINGGRIEQAGTPLDLYNHPATLFVAGFLGTPRMNFIAAEVAHADARTVHVRLPDGALVEVMAGGSAAAPGDQVTLGIRAEHLAVCSGTQADNQVAAEVRHVEYLGDQTIAYCAVAGSEALLAVRQQADGGATQAGAGILLHLPPRRCHLFDSSGRALVPLWKMGAPQKTEKIVR